MSGRGTSSGVIFQSEVGAYIAGLLLSERHLSRLGEGLPGIPRKLFYEVPGAVDDIVIVTDCGTAFIQAKNTISLSSNEESELASVADQFVRQYKAGVDENGTRRDLAPVSDRLVLAVGIETPSTIANNLREALDRNRTGAATGLPNHLADALKKITELIETAWLNDTGSPISSADTQSILSVCSIIVVGDDKRQLVEEALRDIVVVPGDETTLVDLLAIWSANAAASGTGGDTFAIRLALSDKVRLAAPPSYQEDIKKLFAHSTKVTKQLKRFALLNTVEGEVTIERPIVKRIIEAAQQGSLVITGEPGAGKSAATYAAAGELAVQSPVVFLSVDANAITLDALRIDIGLTHPVLEVLQHTPNARLAYLFLDALDAGRSEAAQTTYKKLIEGVLELSGWHVVASIRTFEFRNGKEWRRIFKGIAPFAEDADKSFKGTKHIHVGLLTDGELADLAAKSPSLTAAIEAGEARLENLARNPFNLSLFADLTLDGIEPSSLASVATRGELLSRYWEERIAGLGTPAAVGLDSLVAQMLAARAIDAPQNKVTPATAEVLDKLEQAGVLIIEATRRVGFRHHVLFDYAVSRALVPHEGAVTTYLLKEQGAGLLITPSLGYWIEDLKNNLALDDFWLFVAALVSNEAVDPIVRVEVARLAAELAKPKEDLSALKRFFERPDVTAHQALKQFVGAIMIKAEAKQPIVVEPWALLLSQMTKPQNRNIGLMHMFIGALLDQNPAPDALTYLGIASRKLFNIVATDNSLTHWLSKFIIPYIARTYGTDPTASRRELDKIFIPERFENFGHIELPELTRHILSIAPHDSDLVVQIFYRAFLGGNFSRHQTTSMMNSWIMSFTSDAAQDFRMAQHHLAQVYPKLLKNLPIVGIQSLSTALRGVYEGGHSSHRKRKPDTISVNSIEKPFLEDGSYIWAWEIEESHHSNYAKIYQDFLKWLPAVVDTKILNSIPDLVIAETSIALAWRMLFEAGLLKVESIGLNLWRSASSFPALHSSSSRQSAINLLTAIYPGLAQDDREAVEQMWLQWDFASDADPTYMRTNIVGTLFESIGAEQLATAAARGFLQQAQLSDISLKNSKLFESKSSTTPSDFWSERDIDSAVSDEVKNIQTLTRTVIATLNKLQEPNEESHAALQEAVASLDKFLNKTQSSSSAEVDAESAAALAEGLGRLLSLNLIPSDERIFAITRLLALSHHPSPVTNSDTEEEFAKIGSWGGSFVRVEVAKALGILVSSAESWPLIRDRFEQMMLTDPHPAVRLQLVGSLPRLSSIDIDARWSLSEKFASNETNPEIIKWGTRAIESLAHRDALRLEPLIIQLSRRAKAAHSSNDITTQVICFLAFDKNLSLSKSIIQEWVDDYQANESNLTTIISFLREKFALGYGNQGLELKEIRIRVNEFIWNLITRIEPVVISWPLSEREPTDEEKAALKLFNEIAEQIYFGVGYDKMPSSLASSDEQRLFIHDYASLILKLATLGTPKTVHYILDTLSKFVDAEPTLCFDLFSAAILRTTGVAKYEYEPLGAGRFAQLVEQYLADHRSLFVDDSRRAKLIDCLAVFVDAGWPEARRLFQKLPELLE